MQAIAEGAQIVSGNGDELICRVVTNLELPAEFSAVRIRFREKAAAIATVRASGKLTDRLLISEGNKYTLAPEGTTEAAK